MAKYKFNLIDRDYSDKVNLVTRWAIAVICAALCIALILDGKYLTMLPLAAFTVTIVPVIRSKIELNKYILLAIRIALLVLVFYSIKVYV